MGVFNLSLSGLLGELSGSFKILTLCFGTYKSGSYRSPVLRHEHIFQCGRPAVKLIWERCWGHSHQAKLLWTVIVMGDREIREFRENTKHSKPSLQHHKISLCCPSLSVPFLAQSSQNPQNCLSAKRRDKGVFCYSLQACFNHTWVYVNDLTSGKPKWKGAGCQGNQPGWKGLEIELNHQWPMI